MFENIPLILSYSPEFELSVVFQLGQTNIAVDYCVSIWPQPIEPGINKMKSAEASSVKCDWVADCSDTVTK